MQKNLLNAPKFLSILRKIYTHPASVIIITGDWKTGKTDFALLIYEILYHLGYIKKCASNIEIYKDYKREQRTDEPIKLIQALNTLKIWCAEYGRKLFIYDEAIESSPTRGAMTTLNVSWLRFIPQLSKTHTHLLVLTQETGLIDSIFRNPTFSWGMWTKIRRDMAVFNSRRLSIEEYVLKKVPPTNIIFDPDKIATFTVEETTHNFEMLPRTLQVAELYGQGMKMHGIGARLQIDSKQVQRELIKVCRILVTLRHSHSEGKEVLAACHEEEPKDH